MKFGLLHGPIELARSPCPHIHTQPCAKKLLSLFTLLLTACGGNGNLIEIGGDADGSKDLSLARAQSAIREHAEPINFNFISRSIPVDNREGWDLSTAPVGEALGWGFWSVFDEEVGKYLQIVLPRSAAVKKQAKYLGYSFSLSDNEANSLRLHVTSTVDTLIPLSNAQDIMDNDYVVVFSLETARQELKRLKQNNYRPEEEIAFKIYNDDREVFLDFRLRLRN